MHIIEARDYVHKLQNKSEMLYLDALGVHLDRSYDRALLILLFSLLEDKSAKVSPANHVYIDKKILPKACQVFDHFAARDIQSAFLIGPAHIEALKHYRSMFKELYDVRIRKGLKITSFWHRMKREKDRYPNIALSTHEVDVVKLNNRDILYYTKGQRCKLTSKKEPYVAFFEILRRYPAISQGTFRFLQLYQFLDDEARKVYLDQIESPLVLSLLKSHVDDKEWVNRARTLNALVREKKVQRYLNYDYHIVNIIRED
jgi:hypothetical protein